jgi:hypothetical protein
MNGSARTHRNSDAMLLDNDDDDADESSGLEFVEAITNIPLAGPPMFQGLPPDPNQLLGVRQDSTGRSVVSSLLQPHGIVLVPLEGRESYVDPPSPGKIVGCITVCLVSIRGSRP